MKQMRQMLNLQWLLLIILINLAGCQVKPDKAGHFIAGAVIGGVVAKSSGKTGHGVVAGCAAGAIKEMVDATGYGTPEMADFAYTCAGAGVGAYVIRFEIR